MKLWQYHLYNILVVNYWAWILLGCVLAGIAALGYLPWGWALFGIAIIWYLMNQNYGATKANHLSSYIVYLLLDDDIREIQKKRFREWVHAPNGMALSRRAMAAIQRSADALAAGDPKRPLSGAAFASHAMI